MPTIAVQPLASPSTHRGTSPAKAIGRVDAGPKARRATPPGTGKAMGQTVGG